MFIDRNNLSAQLLQGLRSQSPTQGGGFAAFSFSSSLFSATTLSGLNRACGRNPHNPAINTLGSLFQCISLVQSFQTFRCGGPPRPPSPCPPSPCPPSPCPPPPCPPPQHQQNKMWDVFFDAKSGTKTKQKSPIVLDLNGNGQADITGGNIKGNGKLEGVTVKGFDLDPKDRQWETKSLHRRPGNGAPALVAGVKVQVFDKDGKVVKTLDEARFKALQKGRRPAKGGGDDLGLGLGLGMWAEFRDSNGKLVSELKRDGTNGNKLLYFWGNQNQNEWTKPWDPKKGGDGMLVWDTDGDGKITSGKELFGHIGLDGKNTFKNGYEKLAHYFDKDKDGVVKGAELQGLKIWEDRNGDGITQQGELVELEKHGIRKLSTRFNESDMSSSYSTGRHVKTAGLAPAQASSVSHASKGGVDAQAAMQQTWHIFQLVEVLRQLQQSGLGQR
jgi:hypothetical protein